MRHGTLMLFSALLAALPALPTPAEAQSPRRVLGPLGAPVGMMMRALPRPQYRHRLHRTPRAVHRDRATPRETPTVARSDPRRQAALGAAAGAIAFWPIAAPDAFEDMLGYAFWPREYGRQFWSHGPRDIMQAMTAPTAAYAPAAGADGRLPRLVSSANANEDNRAICVARVKENAMRPLNRIAEAITLDADQLQKLDHLRATVRTAIEAETAACRHDIPATQPQRLRAMIDGLWAMRYAEFRIRPALATFHASLNEAQQAQLAEEPQTVGTSAEPVYSGPAAVCSEPVSAGPNPFEPIQRSLRPTDDQRKSLQMLYGASMEMAQFLMSSCPAETPSTPMARFDAAGDRIVALLHAAMNIEPMLNEFYSKLSDQQRRRFNSIR